MADYDLGTAHGNIVIEYDDRGSKQAKKDFGSIGDHAEALVSRFRKLKSEVTDFSNHFGETGASAARTFGVLAGGASILVGMSRATGLFTGALFKMRGGLGIVSALGIGLGGLPDSVAGFPNIIKQIILLSSAITLFAGSTRLLGLVQGQIAKFIGSTAIVQRFAAAFPNLAARLKELGGGIPNISRLGDAANKLGRPVHTIARLALAIGSLIKGVKIATSLAKSIGILAGAISALTGGIQLVAALGAELINLSGLIGLLPAAGFAAAAAIGTLVVGMQGFGEAMKNIGDPEKFEEAIKNLAPSAQDAARAIRDLKKPFDDLRLDVQQRLFAGLGPVIRDLGARYMPVLRGGMNGIADAFNDGIKQASAFFKESQTINDVRGAFENTRRIVNNLMQGLRPILQILRDVGSVGLEVLRDLTAGFGASAQGAADFVKQARESGKLKEWIQGGIDTLKNFIGFLRNVGSILNSVFQAFAGGGGDGLFATLNQASLALANFLKTAEGQNILNTWATAFKEISGIVRDVLLTAFRELTPAVAALLPFIRDLVAAFGGTLKTAIEILAPIIRGLAEALSFMSPVLAPLLGGLLGLGIAAKVLTAGFGLLTTGLGLLSGGFSLVMGAGRLTLTILTMIGNGVIAAGAAVGRFVVLLTQMGVAMARATVAGFVGGLKTMGSALATVGGALGRAALAVGSFIARLAVATASVVASMAVQTASVVASVATQIARWIALAATAVARAAVIAAAWLAANPIVLIAAAIAAIVALIIMNWDSIVAFLTNVWNWIKDLAATIWNAIAAFFTALWNGIVAFFQGVWNGLVAFLSGVWNGIAATAQGIWNGIRDFFVGLWNGIRNTFTSVVDGIKNFLSNAWNTIKNVAIGAFNQLKDAVSNAINNVLDFVRGLPGRILGALGDLGNLLYQAGRNIIQGLINGIKNMVGAVSNAISNVVSTIRSFLPFSPAKQGPLSGRGYTLYSGQALVEDLAAGISSRIGDVKDATLGVVQTVGNTVDSMAATAYSPMERLGTTMMQGVQSGIASGIPAVVDTMKSALDNLRQVNVQTTVSDLGRAAQEMLNSINSGGGLFEDFSFRGNSDLVRRMNDQIADLFYAANPGYNFGQASPQAVTDFLNRLVAQETTRTTTPAAATPSTRTVQIGNVTVQVTGNLDPTNKVLWRQAMVEIQEGLENLGKQYA